MRRKKDKSNGITALYERLSRDDDNAGESNSIVHQKQMLEDYAMKHGFTNLVHFTDDGWSGATFDRPSWNRLVEGVKNVEITACICKDMSRIGRDHLQVGFFTDILFREKEVRFIAINNGIDSDRQETSEFAPFLNIMNEWFVRDTSKKIKAVLKSRGSSGNAHTSNIPPYGYLKDPENPDHWIIDEEAAEVVRRIYRMTIEGKGPYQIARELSEEKIERPSYYLGKKGLGNHASNYDKENPYMWRGNQVTTLIARPEYIGKTVNFRTFKNSYKDKKTKRADKEDWVVFDDTQEPIVDEETWLLAQKLRQNVRKAAPMGEPNVLTGKIYCADCGAPMYNHRQRKGRERIYYTAKGEKRTSHSNPADCYECSTYNLGRQKYDRHCTCHHISTKALKSIILKTIQETCHYVSLNEQEFVYSLQEESAMKDIAVSETVKKRIERNQKRLHELDIEYTFHAFCKIVIRNASYTALRTWSRKHKREISLDYITDEKHYPLGTTDEYFKAPEPDEEYIVHLCGDTVILSNGLLVQALSRLPAQKQEMLYLSFFKRMPQHEIGRRYGRSRSAAGYHIRKTIQQLYEEMEGLAHEE